MDLRHRSDAVGSAASTRRCGYERRQGQFQVPFQDDAADFVSAGGRSHRSAVLSGD